MTLRLRRAAVRRHRLVSRLLPRGYHAYRFAGGRIYLDTRESPAMLARALGLYETEKVDLLRRVLRPGMTFVDIGGNKGDFSLIAARLVGDGGRVLVFEPEPTNCAWLRRSISLNGYRNVTLHDFALSDREGWADLHLGANSGWHTLVRGVPGRDHGVMRVRTRRLDDVLSEAGVATVDAVKIDVEGAEMGVLEGAATTLAGTAPMCVLVDVHPPLVDPAEVGRFLSDRGFRLHRPSTPDRPLDRVPPDLRELLALR